MKPKVRIITGDEVIDREMTDDEHDEYLTAQTEREQRQQAETADKLAAESCRKKLGALGFTEREIERIIP